MGYKIVLTSDRTMASDYHGLMFLGFTACLPRTTLFPDWLYYPLFCPSGKHDREGRLLYANCGVRKIEASLLDLYRRTQNDADSNAFESEGLAVLWPRLEAKARLLEPEGFNRLPKSTQCGSLRYDAPKPETPRRIFFHIGNAVCPKSIFDDPAYLPECLRCLMRRSAAEFGADSLETSTWLNSYPKWLSLFPAEWREHLGPEMRDVRIGMGYWGQFVNAAGGFNAKHARLFRETGRFPFPPRHSWCTFAALEKHLQTKENS